MPIQFVSGDILDAPKDSLVVIPVNLQAGVMGAGLAKQAADRLPDLKWYHGWAAKYGPMDIGVSVPGLFADHDGHERYILLFPTKRHWKDKSKLEWIEDGLINLAVYLEHAGNHFASLSLPRIGAGLGGLAWEDVRKLIAKHLGKVKIDVLVYESMAQEEAA